MTVTFSNPATMPRRTGYSQIAEVTKGKLVLIAGQVPHDTNDKLVGQTDSTDQFWTGANGSRCSAYSGALGWSFASNGHLTVTFGGTAVTL